jgi:arsenate reductase
MTDAVYNVLFLCTGNSARSILAEAILNQLGAGNFRAYSAGSHPKGEVHLGTLEILRRMKFDVSSLRSKSWDEFAKPDAPRMDFVFTVCDNAAGETCPLWPGQPITAHWGFPDPAAVTSSPEAQQAAFTKTFHELSKRIQIFLALPLEKIDHMSLQKQLRDLHNSGKPA